jgi:stalled ribosome rescue protein Dom34
MPTSHFHAVAWMDHREAHVFHFNSKAADEIVVRAERPKQHLHHKAGAIGAGHAAEDRHYFAAIVEALADAGAVLVIGPANAKTEFMKYARETAPAVASRVKEVIAADQMTDAQVLALAREKFKVIDRKTPQR